MVKAVSLRRIIGFLLLAWCYITAGAAVFDENRVVNLMLNDGLAGETVYNVITDHSGHVWMATSSGVNAFNGLTLNTFRILNKAGERLAVYDLCELGEKQIWAATEEGLFYIDIGGKPYFEQAFPEVKHPTSLLAVGDTLYIGCHQGFLFYDGQKLNRIDTDVRHSGLENIVRQYVKGDDGLIWFLSRFDLNSFDPRTGKVTRHLPSLGEKKLALSKFAYIGNRRFVVGTKVNGLFLCDLQSGTTEHIEGVGSIVTTVQRSADGNICVACDGSGAYVLDSKTLEIKERFNTEGEGLHLLPSNGVYCYYRDPNGINWFGFVRNGLAYTYYSGNLFKPFGAGDFTAENINVRTFCLHGDDMVIGSQNGFYYVNARTGQHHYYSPSELSGGHIVNTIVWHEGLFYIGTFDGGLHTFDPTTMSLKEQTISPIFDEISIGDLKVSSDGRLWIGCTHGLAIVDKGKIQQHFTEQNSHITGGLIISITFDSQGNAWLTGANGCSLYSARSHDIVDATFPDGFFNNEPWMRGAQGHDRMIFMRTGPRTFYTNEQMTDFGELKLPITFADKWCRNLVDDMNGHYLLTSERGVSRIGYDLKEMMHFGYGEGLRGRMINDMSLSPDGILWVSTSQGLFYADAKDIAAWQHSDHHKIELYNIRCGSDLMTPERVFKANEEHSITLGWNFTSEVLQLRPLLLDYSKQTARLYEYRLDGNDWQLVDVGEDIGIRRLLLGRHTLVIRLAGAHGTASTYNIMVLPSVWAILELVLLCIALVLLWLWWRYRRNTKVLLSERDMIEEALIESEELRVKNEELSTKNDESKYQKVKLDEEECADIVQRMKGYLEEEKAYTNVDLKMSDLAKMLHVSPSKLSQIFTQYLGESYYDFINAYRLAEFKRLIENGQHKNYTLTALSEQSGFKRANFFSTFRRVEGMTPAEYLKRKGIRM